MGEGFGLRLGERVACREKRGKVKGVVPQGHSDILQYLHHSPPQATVMKIQPIHGADKESETQRGHRLCKDTPCLDGRVRVEP